MNLSNPAHSLGSERELNPLSDYKGKGKYFTMVNRKGNGKYFTIVNRNGSRYPIYQKHVSFLFHVNLICWGEADT